MKRTIAFLAALLVSPLAFAADAAKPDDKPHIDVVFCIDCSGSMGPVIETAKQKVWAIVNEVAKAKPTPNLRVALWRWNAEGAPRLEIVDPDGRLPKTPASWL